ncbi:hypothetical protein, partial [Phormidium sp. CCY1219]|uniref:hypothetical protein n=1 Tax=Phormidium sp. CCY1219 TaxID=2886104 RepID=UPI002D1E8CFB
LRSQFPDAAIFLSGTVAVDFPEDLKPQLDPLKLSTLTVSGSNVTLTYHPIERAIADLNDQYAIGNLQLKIFSVRPDGF